MDSLQLDIRPTKRSEISLTLNARAYKEFCDFVYSFGITYEENEESYSGIDWITEGDD